MLHLSHLRTPRVLRRRGRVAVRQHHGVALSGCAKQPQRLGPKHLGQVPQATRQTGIAAKQVDAHHPVGGKQFTAVPIKRRMVQQRAGRVVVVQVHLQRMHRAAACRLHNPGRGVVLPHPKARSLARQMKKLLARLNHRRVALYRLGVHTQHTVGKARQ